jgi:hypothetical protein
MVAPPFARQGLPKKPSRKRRKSSPPRLSTNAVGRVSMVKRAKVVMYGMFLPSCGTAMRLAVSIIHKDKMGYDKMECHLPSLNGANNNGPIPYPKSTSSAKLCHHLTKWSTI